MHMLLVRDDIVWKKLRYTLRVSHKQSYFEIFHLSISLQVEKKFHSLCTQFAAEPVTYAGFWKGGGGGRKFEKNKDLNQILFYSNLVRLLAQKLGEEQKKKVFTQISSDF